MERYHNTATAEVAQGANLAVAKAWAAHGFSVMPLRYKNETLKNGEKRKAKSPRWTNYAKKATTDLKRIERVWGKEPDLLVGVLTGPGTGLAVVDLDRHGEKDGFAALVDLKIECESDFVARTAGGGEHRIFTYVPGILSSNGKVAPGIDVKSETATGTPSYIVAPGTVAPWGCYEWVKGDIAGLVKALKEKTMPPIPIVMKARKDSPEPRKKSNGEKTGLPFAEVAEALMAILNDGSNPDMESRDSWLHIGMGLHHETDGDEDGRDLFHEWSAQHPSYDAAKTDDAWNSFGGDGLTAATILREAYRHGWHNAAAHERHIEEGMKLIDECWTSEELDRIRHISAEESEADRKQEYLLSLDAEAFALMYGPISKEAVPVLPSEGKPILRGDKLVINLHNTTLYLSRDLEAILPGLAHNQMTGRDEWQDGQLTDAAISIARMALEKRGLETVGKDLVADAAKTVALKRAYHPIRNDLNALRWDGAPRLESWLVRYAGADDTPYTCTVSRKFLIAMVARVMHPGCKHDHTLVLSGEQGQNKSKMCKALAGEQYFSETLPSIRSDKTDAIRHLQGKWLVELAELAPSRTSDAEDLKAFLSGAVDRVRMPYAKFDEAFPRQCVFVGTTNDDQFLRDATGGRRFWPVAVRKVIDVDALADERDQLFAEAVAAFKEGESWWLDREFESKHAAPVQAAAYVSDSWVDDVAPWLDKPQGDQSEVKMEVTISEILSDALNVSTERQTQPVQKRVASVLRQIGWIKVKTKTSNKWRRPE
ncbi:bifunctional DNA primase/polymerase [Roseobacter sp. YSTF-M11]|uniref:Bifunctional DNA primase/polymerase n=1 Tax=Roseobacter insulae TaxID=2859783 RepID=A0A9X1K300_9RHOB|nr:VapE domain-containing protein [Roseobacter insulae]MBW4708117.1 bifunctional DNA primase/polymerase [Roseobacter insulae]